MSGAAYVAIIALVLLAAQSAGRSVASRNASAAARAESRSFDAMIG
jgi:hypothetical protein